MHARYGSLTEREREIMMLVVSGHKQIAADLSLSEVTVKAHRGKVVRKMRERSPSELVRMADRLGLQDPTS